MPDDPPRIPLGLGAKSYAAVWDSIAQVREHAFELVDESKNESELTASGERLAPYLIRGLGMTPSDVVFEIGCGVARLGKPIAPMSANGGVWMCPRGWWRSRAIAPATSATSGFRWEWARPRGRAIGLGG